MNKLSSIVLTVCWESCNFFQHRANTVPCNWRKSIFHGLKVYNHTCVCSHVLLYLHIIAKRRLIFRQRLAKAIRSLWRNYLPAIGEFDLSWRQYHLQNSFVTQTRRKWLILMSHFAQVIITSNNAHRYFEKLLHLT